MTPLDDNRPVLELGASISFSSLTPPETVAATAVLLESSGFTSIWAPEHVVWMSSYTSAYPYSPDGSVVPRSEGKLDPFSVLFTAAAATTSLRLGTGVCLLPQRDYVYTARTVADLDYLSGGRFDFGVGVGWAAEEFELLGRDFSTRGIRCDEYLRVMIELWTATPASFEGETVTFHDLLFNPKPAQNPYPPVYIGGNSRAAFRRIAAIGDGWYGFALSPDDTAAGLRMIREFLDHAGRDPAAVRVTMVVPPRDQMPPVEELAAFSEAGVDQLVLSLSAEDFSRLADTVGEATQRLQEL